MQLREVKVLCDQLREVVAAGPGRNDLALQEAVGVVSMLQQAAPWNGPRDKLVTIRGWLTIWFSHRRWRQYGDEGEICQQSILNDVLVVESYWERRPAVRAEGTAGSMPTLAGMPGRNPAPQRSNPE